VFFKQLWSQGTKEVEVANGYVEDFHISDFIETVFYEEN
jgi:hypothetical protein